MQTRKNLFHKIMAVMLSAIMLIGLAACGKTDQETKGSQVDAEGSYVWAPSYQLLPKTEEDGNTSVMGLVGSRIYYSQTIYGEEMKNEFYYIDMEDGDGNPVKIYEYITDNSNQEYQTYVNTSAVSQDGGIILIILKYPIIMEMTEEAYAKQQRETTYSVTKVAEDGSIVFDIDITPDLKNLDIEDSWLQYALTDQDNNIYLSYGSYVLLYDKDGNHLLDVNSENESRRNYISAMGLLPDGRIAMKQDNQSGSLEIRAYNQEKKAFSDVYANLPQDSYNSGLGLGLEGGVLLTTGNSLVEYDLETQTYADVLNWIDCDINPDYVNFASAMPNGKILTVIRDWETNETEIAVIAKTEASEVVQKKVLTLGCVHISQNLQKAVVDFNKTNEEYRIIIKDYADASEDGTTDAVTRFNNDVLTGNAPDIFVPDNLNMDQLAAKGGIEDLGPYLEKSDVVSRSDLFESVLEAYTKSDILCAIPSSFYVLTVFGRTSEVGEDSGWTFVEMMDYARQYPDSSVFTYASKTTILQYVLMFDLDSYVNWETGECSFDTPEFKQVLEFAASYPDEADYEASEVKLIRNGEALLHMTALNEPHSWQILELIYDEPVTAIGFPSANSSGVVVNGTDNICISASSSNKEAAWSFIESMLSKESQSDNFLPWGFPIRKDAYDELMDKAMEITYARDENGDILLDENGEPVMYSTMNYGWNDISFDLYAVTQEEKDKITQTIDNIQGMVQWNMPGVEIIYEEAASYFAGDKTVDEVAEIIQSRVKIYVNENR